MRIALSSLVVGCGSHLDPLHDAPSPSFLRDRDRRGLRRRGVAGVRDASRGRRAQRALVRGLGAHRPPVRRRRAPHVESERAAGTGNTPLVAMLGAAVFAISCMPVPVPTAGTCSHPCGTGLAAIFVGPSRAVLLTVVALILQALFLAHGGSRRSAPMSSRWAWRERSRATACFISCVARGRASASRRSRRASSPIGRRTR